VKQESCVRLIREKTPCFGALWKAVMPVLPERITDGSLLVVRGRSCVKQLEEMLPSSHEMVVKRVVAFQRV
jgi:hypothetical protein